MLFRMLGPLRLWNGTGWSSVRAAQQRVVLAVLLAERRRSVTVDQLIDEVWGGHPPDSAVKTIQVYVMRLRRQLGADFAGRLVTQPRGYMLQVDEPELDAGVFEQLVQSSRQLPDQHRPETSAARLTEALALWRGPVLADVPAGPTVTVQVAQLTQARLDAMDERLEALLTLGCYAEVVAEARRMVDEHPLRERSWAQLMLALSRLGRRSDALAIYQQARRVLVAELGLEPGTQLRELHQTMLTDEPDPPGVRSGPSAAAAAVPAQLPTGPVAFTGRAEHLTRLDALLPDEGRADLAVVISTIAGTAGVGKTALALHWAHQVRERFPDGQLFVNLRGHGCGSVVRPVEALAGFLLALGVPADEVPPDMDQAAALYRSLLTGKRTLVVLDNAGHPDQVRPLLPASPGCLVLVTSRDRLLGLVAVDGAVRVELEVLTAAESDALLDRLLGPERVHAERFVVGELARLCGYLPLALRIAAANLNIHPQAVIGDYVAMLAGADRLFHLEVDRDPNASVRAAFDHSYTGLPADTRRMFRLLGLVPGPDVTAPAAAALADLPTGHAARLLNQLASAHLLSQHDPGRYTFHDLLRHYAAAQAVIEDGEPDRRAATDRLYDWYLRNVAAAGHLLYPQRLSLWPTLPGGFLDDHAQALAWLDGERSNLVAVVGHAAAHGPGAVAWRLADALRGYFVLRSNTVDWARVAEAALTAATTDPAHDLRGLAAAEIGVATLHWFQDHAQQAIEHYRQAHSHAQQARWAEAESVALGGLGVVHWVIGRLREAAEYCTQALAIDRRTGWLTGQASRLGNLGVVYESLGQLEHAAEHQTEALALYRKTEARGGEAITLGNLGEILHKLGRLDEALTTLTQATPIAREVSDSSTECNILRVLAGVHRDAGRHAEAHNVARSAVALAQKLRDPWLEASALIVLGTLENLEHALDQHRRALELAREMGNRSLETEALLGLADTHRQAGDLDAATEHTRNALLLARQDGFGLLEGNALTTLAAIRLAQGDTEKATNHARQALTSHTRTGHRPGHVRARLIAEHAYRNTGHIDT